MAASKSLILKGISGFAATCLAAAGGFEVKNLFQSSSSSSSSLEKNDEDEFEGESKEDDDLGVPSSCFISECDLTAEQLRKLKFERRSDSSISVGGLSDNDTFELTVEETGDTTNYPKGKKYILKAKETTGTVTIEGVKGGDVVLEAGGEGVDLREKESGGGLEKVPEELNNLGIPKRCEGEADGEQTSKTCELTKEQLLRLKFETKSAGGSIRVSGLTEKNTVTLTIENKENDTENYPHGKKYTLKSTTGTVTIRGVKDGDIVLEKDRGIDFREKSTGEQLETVENSLGIPRRCETSTESPCQLTKDELQKLKFETEDESSITVEELTDNETVELTIENKESDLINYPKGKKYTLKTTEGNAKIKGVKGGDIELEAGEDGVVIREKESGGLLEKAPEEVNNLGIPKSCTEDSSCELTADQLQRFKFEPKGNEAILVEGLTAGNKVTLEIEDKESDKTNFPQGKKYSITSSKDKVTIRNVKEGDIVLEAKGNVVIRETVKGGKLEEVPEEVDKLGIPNRCASRSCKLTKEQLLMLRFEPKTSSPIKIEGLEGESTVDLTVTEAKNDQTNYPKGKKYTLKSTNGKVTIKGVKGGDIDIEDKGVVVREKRDGVLLERAPEEVDELGIPTICTPGSTCKLTKDQLKKIKFDPKSNKTSIWISGMGVKDKVDLKVEESKYTNYYPKGKMYTFTSDKDNVTIKGVKEGDIVLDKDKDVLIRETSGGKKLETSLDVLGIPKGCKAEEVKKRPDTRTCELTADQLKHLKLKAFEGKAGRASVSGLNGENKITLKISWDEDGSTYPDNKKYSFDNTNRDGEIRITKAGQEVKIEKKKESWFKNVNGQLELVEANTRSQVKMKEANGILKKLGLEWLILSERDFTDSNPIKHQQKKFEQLGESDLKKISFKVLDGKANEVVGLSGKRLKVFLDWDGASNRFPNNMKFTFENGQISPNVELKRKDKRNGETVKIWKKENDNKDNKKNKFKVENDQLVNVP